jgi:hypothetical protein
MKAEKISLIINSICKELGICYNSVNPHLLSLLEDAEKVNKIYFQLKDIIEVLIEIEDRHNIKGLTKSVDEDLNLLDTVEHNLLKIAKLMRDKNV